MLEIFAHHINLNKEAPIYTVSFLILQNQHLIETNVVLILECFPGQEPFLEDFFENKSFAYFRQHFLNHLLQTTILLRDKKLTKPQYEKKTDSMVKFLSFYSMDLFSNELLSNEKIPNIVFQRKLMKGSEYVQQELKMLRCFVSYNVKLADKLEDLEQFQKWMDDEIFQLAFFFNTLYQRLLYKKQSSAGFILLDENNLVEQIDYNRKNWGKYFKEEQKFEFLKELDFYIKDEKLLSEITSKINSDFLKKKHLKRVFNYNKIFFSIYPRQLYQISESCGFLLQIKEIQPVVNENGNTIKITVMQTMMNIQTEDQDDSYNQTTAQKNVEFAQEDNGEQKHEDSMYDIKDTNEISEFENKSSIRRKIPKQVSQEFQLLNEFNNSQEDLESEELMDSIFDQYTYK